MMSALKVDFRQKGGKAFQRHLLMQKVDDKLKKKFDHFESQESLLELSRKENFSYEQMMNFLNQVADEYKGTINPEVEQQIISCIDTLYKCSQLEELDYMTFFKEFNSSYAPNKPIKTLSFRSADGTPFAFEFELINNFINSISISNATINQIEEYLKYIQKDVSKEALTTMIKSMHILKNNSYLDKLVQVLSPEKNTYLTPFKNYEPSIKEEIDKFVAGATLVIKDFYMKKKDSQVKQLIQKLFPDGGAITLHHYSSEKNSTIISSGGNKTFKYIDEMELAYSFIVQKYAEDIKELLNNLVIKGTFHNEETRKLVSDTFFSLSEIINQFIEFENNISPEGDDGNRIWRTLAGTQSSKDLNPMGSLNELIEKINNEAKQLINQATGLLKRLYNILDLLIKTSQANSKKFLNNINDFAGPKTPFVIQNQYTEAFESVKLFFQILQLKSKETS